ncbi:SusC/RagA family TonB-linked outer membrane protein [Flavobacteriaceae bacterium]|jgi:TonB-linked SusC/RagA family outer membrane protein|nr:SusC/RagA family TonB-linked outer membrane protein [Flavobacteriaceae bacterium]MDC3330011.1 SusC/RagA family TonB-linked outer membrane protein [Flavobacteriaceae bacterium]
MKKEFLKKISFLFTLLLTIGTYAQSVSGIVMSEDGPLPGATVQVKGTNIGTSTDFDGNFTIQADGTDVLIVSFVGFTLQEVPIEGQDQITVTLQASNELDEVIITGYGTQKDREITSAVVNVEAEDFNQGPINDAAQLLQGKVAGLQIYKPGGNPNENPTIRLRGISTLGANTSPLVVIDGVPGATLANIDPNDIESMTVLKDGSAAAIYGARGSSGVILVTTKRGSTGKTEFSYNGQYSVSSISREIPVLSAQEFLTNGGTDIGNDTDWIDAITRQGQSQIHNFSAGGGSENTNYRVSANLRDVEGILNNTGFKQLNTRANVNTKAFNDKLTLNFNLSYTKRDADRGDERAFEFAQFYNPTAPIYGADSPFVFNSAQYGGYFEQLGLFRSYNPVSIIEQTRNTRNSTDFNYNVNAILEVVENLDLTFRAAEQRTTSRDQLYRPTTLLFEGNAVSPTRRGLASLGSFDLSTKVYEIYGAWDKSFGSTDLVFTAGYSYNQINTSGTGFSLGDFPDNTLDYSDAIQNSQDLLNDGYVNANSYASPDEKIIAFFGRLNLTLNNNIFVNASLRQEGSSKLGEDNKWGLFPSVGLGADFNSIFDLGFDQLKVRFGYGSTGSLPSENGLSLEARNFVYSGGGSAGGATTLARAANPDLKWEEKGETNLGIEFKSGPLSIDFDIYNRVVKDFIIDREVDASIYGVNRRFENAGQLSSQGVELALGYDIVNNGTTSYNTGIVLSSNTNTLDEYVLDRAQYGYLGSPGQNAVAMVKVQVGQPLGEIYGPVWEGVTADGGNQFRDVNGDGTINTDAGNVLNEDYDGEVLGQAFPTLELGWTNQVVFGDWSINAFFRGAFGHSLINTFRAFYEPNVPSQTSYNQMNTRLREPTLGVAQYSSLYVEKADFFLLDNLTIAKQFNFGFDKGVKSAVVSLNANRPFVITNYTGTDPAPELFDAGNNADGGAAVGTDALLAPGIDRRADYFAARSFTIGLRLTL